MTTLHEAAQQAWADWVGKRSDHLRTNHNENIFKAGFEAALAQQGEPVAKYIGECQDGSLVQLYEDLKKGTELYAGATPAAQPDDAIIRAWQAGYYHAGYTHDQAYADKMAWEYAGAAPAAQPDASKVVEQMVDALEDVNRWRNTGVGRPPEQTSMAAIQSGQQWLEGNK